MPRPLRVASILGLALLLSAPPARAEGLSPFESIAFQDFMVWQCSRNEPARTAEFARLRQPPHTCAATAAAVLEQARKSPEYQAMHSKLAREMGSLSRQRLMEFCQAALQTRC